MSIASQQRSLLHSVAEYEKLLPAISEEDFLRSPAGGVWSYSEVYSHIFQANLGSLTALEKCIIGTGVESHKSIRWLAWIILFFGRFPPGKLKAPERIAAVAKKINKEEAANLIIKFKKRAAELYPQIKKASPVQKMQHPRLGLLNATQWFRFIEIHTLHHQKQLQRISKLLK